MRVKQNESQKNKSGAAGAIGFSQAAAAAAGCSRTVAAGSCYTAAIYHGSLSLCLTNVAVTVAHHHITDTAITTIVLFTHLSVPVGFSVAGTLPPQFDYAPLLHLAAPVP